MLALFSKPPGRPEALALRGAAEPSGLSVVLDGTEAR